MTLTETLKQYGFDLTERVGFRCEFFDEGGIPNIVEARIGRICENIDEIEIIDKLSHKKFNHETDLLVRWDHELETKVNVVFMPRNASIKHYDLKCIRVSGEEGILYIGQSDDFMDSVCSIIVALYQP